MLNSDQIEALVISAQQGDQQSFSTIVTMNQQKVFRYCYSMLMNHQDAEDIVQDTFIKAYHHLHQYHNVNNFFGWLITIAHRLCLNKLRKNKLTFGLMNKLTVEHQSISYAHQSSEQLEDQENEEVFKLLNLLKPKQRSIVILKVIQGFNYDEMSHILHDKPANLRKQFERAKKRLQQSINRLDIESECDNKHEFKPELRASNR